MALTINFNNSIDENAAYIHLKKLYPANKIERTARYFDDMPEELEDECLLIMAERRMKKESDVISHDKLWKKFGITEEDIEDVEADEFE
ncbi:MAG: hypothetical protein FWH10_02270 [Oscillospiraceae bacterium]|nr:hypothetical protein [Oscillospiraceae bacterium]